MYLSKLEIRGFKSFKDKEILEFPESFSAIIGPNGSGKTNIVDAICFVLGSSRNLRAKRLEELICNGGTKGEKVKSAKVSLYLKENGSSKRIKISREVDLEGKSGYRLDGKRVLREEVLELVGGNEYNIIHQNDVTKIIDMKPVQRREIIDDLCGLKEYEQKKEKAMEELEKVEKKFSQTNIVLGEKKGYLGGLKGERDEALRYKEITDKLKSCKGTIIKYNLEKGKAKEDKIKGEITSLQKEKDQNLLKIKKIRDEINEKTTKIKALNQEIFRLGESLEDEEILQLREDYVRREEEVEYLKNEVQSLEEDILSKREKKKEVLAEKGPLPREIEKVQVQLSKLKPQIESLGKGTKSLDFERELQELKSNLKWLKSVGGRNLEERSELEEKKTLVENKLKESLAQKENFSREYEAIKGSGRKLSRELEGKRESLKKIIREQGKIEPRLDILQGELARKKAEIETLRKSPSKGAVARAIMKIVPVVKGIYGTAQELGSPDPHYEKALTVAGGGRLYALGVKDEETAKKCIHYLRKKKIGRATFLPLNKLRVKVRENAPKEAIGFARDFIKCQEKFKSVFRWVFGDTLLVRDLDIAKQISIGKWPMITLEGDLISPGGAISGGYLKAKKVFSTEGEIKKEILTLEKKIVELTGERECQRVKIEKIRKKILEGEESLQAQETRQEKIKINLESLQGKILELGGEEKGHQKKLLELMEEIKRRDEQIKKIQKEVESKEKKYLELGRGRIAEQLKELEEEYHQSSIRNNSLQEKDKFLTQRESELDKEIKALVERRKELEKREKQTQQKISDLKESLEKKKGKEKGIENDMKKLTDSKESLDEGIMSLGEKRGRIEYELEGGNEKLNRSMVKKAKIEATISELEKEFKEYQGVEFLEEKIPELERTAEELGREMAGFGFINMRAIENYKIVKRELDEMGGKLETLRKEKQSILNFMEKVEGRKREIFMEAFRGVKKNFEEIFKELGGGKGTLRLDHISDLSKAGLIIKASPGDKKLMNLDMLSGGEKVLTCSAFLLAIQRYKPSYFYILDELDASLDKRNSLKLAEMLKASSAQFILVTHNDAILKHAKSIIGVSMQDGLSQVVGVKLAG